MQGTSQGAAPRAKSFCYVRRGVRDFCRSAFGIAADGAPCFAVPFKQDTVQPIEVLLKVGHSHFWCSSQCRWLGRVEGRAVDWESAGAG